MSDLEKKLPKRVRRKLAESRKLAKKQLEEIREAERAELRKVANEFLDTIKEEVDSAVSLVDTERLGRLVDAVHSHMSSEIVRVIRAKGFDKELTELCDRVGTGKH